MTPRERLRLTSFEMQTKPIEEIIINVEDLVYDLDETLGDILRRPPMGIYLPGEIERLGGEKGCFQLGFNNELIEVKTPDDIKGSLFDRRSRLLLNVKDVRNLETLKERLWYSYSNSPIMAALALDDTVKKFLENETGHGILIDSDYRDLLDETTFLPPEFLVRDRRHFPVHNRVGKMPMSDFIRTLENLITGREFCPFTAKREKFTLTLSIYEDIRVTEWRIKYEETDQQSDILRSAAFNLRP